MLIWVYTILINIRGSLYSMVALVVPILLLHINLASIELIKTRIHHYRYFHILTLFNSDDLILHYIPIAACYIFYPLLYHLIFPNLQLLTPWCTLPLLIKLRIFTKLLTIWWNPHCLTNFWRWKSWSLNEISLQASAITIDPTTTTSYASDPLTHITQKLLFKTFT